MKARVCFSLLAMVSAVAVFGVAKGVDASSNFSSIYQSYFGTSVSCTFCHTSQMPSLNATGTAFLKAGGNTIAGWTAIKPADATPPTVTITSPATNPYTATSSSLSIAGTASDNFNGPFGVTQVSWSNSLGGSGTATGTTSWSASITLSSGTNVITVTARDAAGNTRTAMRTVNNTPAVAAPLINSFTATATPSSISSGQTSTITLSWSLSGGAPSALNINNNVGSVLNSTSKTVTVATNTTTTYTYTLTASNSGGTVTKTAPVTVTVTPALAAPVINSFTATPSSIASGQSSTLAWNLGGGGATSVTINNASVAGASMKVTPISTTTYTLTVSNSAGSVARSVPVTVTPGTTPPDQLPFFSNPTQITNPYFPLATLERQILQGRTKGGHTVRVERTLLDRTERFKVGEQMVETLIMQDRSFVDGVLEEVAWDYFAQADDGTVYYFGEDVNLYSDGEVVSHEGAWRYGVDTHQLGVIMPAHPEVGTTFQAENVPGITAEDDEVLSVSETVKVRAGRFRNCLLIQETLSDLSVEHKYYAPNVGVIREVTPDGELNLISLGEGGPRPRGHETFRGPRSREHEE